jgi:hypothetical protein
MSISFAELIEALDARPGRDGNYQARCVAHDDRQPSLSIKQGDGLVLLNCFTGTCTYDDIVAALELRGLWPVDDRRRHRNHGIGDEDI